MFWRGTTKLMVAGALVLAGLAVFTYLEWNGLEPAPAQAQGGHLPGWYTVTVDCGNNAVDVTAVHFTPDGPHYVGSPTLMGCQAGGQTSSRFRATKDWNDFELGYECPPGNLANTLQIPADNVVLGKEYTLQCPSTGITHPPAGGDPPGDAIVAVASAPVGGIAELPEIAGSASDYSASSGGSSSPPYAAIAGAAAAAAVALVVSGWYASRRWVR